MWSYGNTSIVSLKRRKAELHTTSGKPSWSVTSYVAIKIELFPPLLKALIVIEDSLCHFFSSEIAKELLQKMFSVVRPELVRRRYRGRDSILRADVFPGGLHAPTLKGAVRAIDEAENLGRNLTC